MHPILRETIADYIWEVTVQQATRKGSLAANVHDSYNTFAREEGMRLQHVLPLAQESEIIQAKNLNTARTAIIYLKEQFEERPEASEKILRQCARFNGGGMYLERGASRIHDAWARFIQEYEPERIEKYYWRKFVTVETPSLIGPGKRFSEKTKRQVETKYCDLTWNEQEFDRRGLISVSRDVSNSFAQRCAQALRMQE